MNDLARSLFELRSTKVPNKLDILLHSINSKCSADHGHDKL
ncbi:hypothetical protein OROMI_004409 [Orobanche minor]